MGRIDVDVRRRVVSDLRNHAKYRRELKELLEDLLCETPPPGDGSPKQQGRTSDPTYSTVVRLHTNARVQFLRHTCETIDRCLFALDKDPDVQRCKQRMIELLYFRQGHTVEKVAQTIGYSARSIYRWNAEVIETIAVEMGYIA